MLHYTTCYRKIHSYNARISILEVRITLRRKNRIDVDFFKKGFIR